MRPQDDYRNGDEAGPGGGSRPGSASGSEEGSGGEADELSLWDAAAPARALNALNALRKSRQHYDVVLLADGAEVPAHRAVLAAASPYLLEALQNAAAAHRVEQVDAESLRALVEYAYTGRLRVRSAAGARRLYRAAWRLRVEPARAHLARRLLAQLRPADALPARALPDLAPDQLHALDDYIADNFDEICESGALAALPVIQIEMLRESSAADGEESPACVAAAALAWLRHRQPPGAQLEDLFSHTHLLYVDAGGVLRDCGELPAAADEAPEVGDYRREQAAAAKRRATKRNDAPAALAETPIQDAIGARVSRGAAGDWGVIAARAAGGGTRALVALGGALAGARVRWRAGGAAGARVPRGGALAAAPAPAPAHARRRAMRDARAALGCLAHRGALLVCGGYDRARVLNTAEAYDPTENAWTPLPDMRCARARFPAAKLGDALYVLGGSDGHAELDSVDVLEGGKWRARSRLPSARGHAAAAADPRRGELYVVGGWAGGLTLRRVDKYAPAADAWAEAPPLITGRSQCAGVLWDDVLWVLGGCDTWHCLASTESLRLAGGPWAAGPPLPTARRSVGGCVWRDRLISVGGSDGSASLKRVDWLKSGDDTWRSGPSMQTPRANLAVAVLNDVLYAVGGFDGKQFLSTMECLYEPDGEWTTLCDPPAPQTPITPDGNGKYPLEAADVNEKRPLQTADENEKRPQTAEENGKHSENGQQN